MKKIVVLATGGTIAGSSASSLSSKYESGKIDINDILDSFNEIKDIAKVCGIDICNIGSQNMNENIWLELARKCNELLSSNEVDAIVITHGTDTLKRVGLDPAVGSTVFLTTATDIIGFFVFFLTIASFVLIAQYLLFGISIYKVAVLQGISKPWMAWIPFRRYQPQSHSILRLRPAFQEMRLL